jgi:hypothetical protein
MAILGGAIYVMDGSGPAVSLALALAWALSEAGHGLRNPPTE